MERACLLLDLVDLGTTQGAVGDVGGDSGESGGDVEGEVDEGPVLSVTVAVGDVLDAEDDAVPGEG